MTTAKDKGTWIWTPITRIKPNPKNRNKHPKDQVERLAKIIEFQGWRAPLVVSNRSGLLVAGHGRLESAKLLKLTEVPVHFQDFKSDEQEYAAGVSDNSIASWSMLDLSLIHADLPALDSFDIDLLGIQNFQFEPMFGLEKKGAKELSATEFSNFEHTCPKCGFEFDKT